MRNFPEDLPDDAEKTHLPYAPPYEPISYPIRSNEPRLAYGIMIAVGISLAFFLAMVFFFVHRQQQGNAPILIITPTYTQSVASTATLPHATHAPTVMPSSTPTPTNTGGQAATATPTVKPKPTATKVPPTVTPTPTSTRQPQ